MLPRCLSTVHILVGQSRAAFISRVSYTGVDAFGSTTHKSFRRCYPGCHTPYTSKPIASDERDLTSVHISDDHPPSHVNMPSPVNNVLPMEVAQHDHSVYGVSTAHNHDGTYFSPENMTPVDILLQYLSRENTDSGNPQICDVETFKSLFMSVWTAGHLKKLGQEHLSALISLFGTLSISPTRIQIYSSSLALHIKSQSPRTYWSFVAQIAVEKENIGWGLTSSDHYWLMRADLAIVSSPDQGSPFTAHNQKKHEAMSRAHREYHFIRRRSTDPDVHGPYFEALLSLQTPRHLRRAAEGMCELLGWSYVLQHPRLLAILWRIILRSGFDLSLTSKEALLTVATKRLWRNAKQLPKDGVVQDTIYLPRIYVSGTIGLTDALTTVIFSPFPPNEESKLDIYKWALSEALTVFALHEPLVRRWNSLVLLALYNTAPAGDSANAGTIIKGRRHYSKTAHLDWDVICVLATIQKSFSRIGPPGRFDKPLNRNVENVGQTLWAKWSESTNRPKSVSRAVAISFFRLAAIAKDATLTAAVEQHCILSQLWNGDSDSAEAAHITSLMVEYIWASFSCGTGSLECIISELHDSFQGPLWQSMIGHIFSTLSQRDIRLASELYSLVHDTTSLPMGTIHALAMSLAQQGLVNVTLPFFREPRISHSQTQELLGAVLVALAKRQHAILHSDVATVVSDVMHSSYSISPPAPKYRAIIQYALPVLASSHHAAKAGDIFELIYSASQTFFSRPFILRFLPVLIKHRQFSSATRILTLLAKFPSRGMGALRKTALLGLSRGGAARLAMRANDVTWRWRNQDILVRLAYGVRFRTNSPSPELTLKNSSVQEKYVSDGPAVQFAMRILVRAGRILAAKRLFFRTRELLDPPVRTSLGNVILDGYTCQLHTQNGRHMRKVLLVYESLIQEGNLVPDRVTVNTMLKAILRWRQGMDSVNLRALFDHMVRNGYPGGEGLRSGQVPFDSIISTHHVFRLPPLESSIVFERHVRPMLKMFIKAFHVRGDVAAASRVIGILKSEENALMLRRDNRRRTRKAGKKWVNESLMDQR